MAKDKTTKPAPGQLTAVDLRASATALPLPAGLFLFSVNGASPEKNNKAGDLQFPALHVAPGPGCPPGRVEFLGVPKSIGIWLYHPDDKLVVKVEDPGATLVLSSVRSSGTQPLGIDVARIDGRTDVKTSLQAAAGTAAQPAVAAEESLKLQLGMHIRNRGDANFPGGVWAGQMAENLWVEAISIKLQETLTSRDIEYKGLSANGFETPWLSDGAVCGTKGISLPLIGFAIRLKPDAAAQYDCEYSGFFQSGITVGPLKNGVPCRSKTASDPVVGIRLRVIKRAGAKASAAAPAAPQAAAPKFSKFREAIKSVAKAAEPAKAAVKKPAADKTPIRKK